MRLTNAILLALAVSIATSFTLKYKKKHLIIDDVEEAEMNRKGESTVPKAS